MAIVGIQFFAVCLCMREQTKKTHPASGLEGADEAKAWHRYGSKLANASKLLGFYSWLGGPLGSFFLFAVFGTKTCSNAPVVWSVWSDRIRNLTNLFRRGPVAQPAGIFLRMGHACWWSGRPSGLADWRFGCSVSASTCSAPRAPGSWPPQPFIGLAPSKNVCVCVCVSLSLSLVCSARVPAT